MVEEEDFELTMKVIVVGNGRVGKSSLITRFVKGTFSEEYKKTLGVAFLEKTSFLKSLGSVYFSFHNLSMLFFRQGSEIPDLGHCRTGGIRRIDSGIL